MNYDELTNLIGNTVVKGQLSLKGEPAEEYTIEYTIGRKDYVAAQMLRYKKIDGATFGKILYDGLEFQFNNPVSQIKYPYFVMYVQEQLETKYGNDINIKNGLKVYTTLRPNLQAKAEEVVREQVASNIKSQ